MTAICLIKANNKLYLKITDENQVQGYESAEVACRSHRIAMRKALNGYHRAGAMLNLIFFSYRYVDIPNKDQEQWLETLAVKNRDSYAIDCDGSWESVVHVNQRVAKGLWEKGLKPHVA